MIRLVGLGVLGVVVSLVGLVVLVRLVLRLRREAGTRKAIRDAQREADSRDSLRRRRAYAQRALEAARAEAEAIEDALDAAYALPVTTTRSPTTRYEHWDTAEHREHPLGWTTVGLTGGVLCAVSPELVPDGYRSVDRWDSAHVAWLRLSPMTDEALRRTALEALGLRA